MHAFRGSASSQTFLTTIEKAQSKFLDEKSHKATLATAYLMKNESRYSFNHDMLDDFSFIFSLNRMRF